VTVGRKIASNVTLEFSRELATEAGDWQLDASVSRKIYNQERKLQVSRFELLLSQARS
jgi:hypothetical protein